MSKADGGLQPHGAGAANFAPPGYYMLFLVNKANVPSVAAWVKLDPAAGQAPVLANQPASPPAGTPATRLIVKLGSFEKRSLKPWKRVSGSNARTRTHKQGKYARVLRGTRRRSGIISRALPKKVTAGTYEVRLWVRGRAYVKVGGGKLKRADSKSSKRWRRWSVTVRVTGPGKRISLRAAKRGRVIVDDVRLIAPRR